MSDQTKLIDRTKALLAKAKGTDNEHEAKKGGRSVTDGLARAAAGQVSLARQMGTGNQLRIGKGK